MSEQQATARVEPRLVTARLLARGRTEGDCLVWTGSTNRKGYGTVSVRGYRTHQVTRVLWESVNGPIPAGLLVCHTCDNPQCFKLEHLFLGTPKDNSQDMSRKGRSPDTRGEKCGKAKLSAQQVAKIHRLRRDGRPLTEIGRMFGVHPAHVSRLVTGKRWSHLRVTT